jgi:hypothetical protein
MMKVFHILNTKIMLSGNPVDFYRKFNLDLEVEQTNYLDKNVVNPFHIQD